MRTAHRGRKLTVITAAVALAWTGMAASPAYAGGIDIVGDTNVGVKATATVSDNTVSKGDSVTGAGKIAFYYHLLGIPLPNTGYYVNSFPWSVTARPTAISWNHPLNSSTYQKFYNTDIKSYQWEVQGSDGFIGDMTVNIKGKAKTDTKGSGYFYAGTYTCVSWSGCRNAGATQLVKVS